VARVRLFAAAREAAGLGNDQIDAVSLGALLDTARDRYGPEFAVVLATARVWINGDEPAAGPRTALDADDEVAILPPVSGGAGRRGAG
jgi:molybdopterin synthase sulfur carrier subunit